jgi:hypothetical protein
MVSSKVTLDSALELELKHWKVDDDDNGDGSDKV